MRQLLYKSVRQSNSLRHLLRKQINDRWHSHSNSFSIFKELLHIHKNVENIEEKILCEIYRKDKFVIEGRFKDIPKNILQKYNFDDFRTNSKIFGEESGKFSWRQDEWGSWCKILDYTCFHDKQSQIDQEFYPYFGLSLKHPSENLVDLFTKEGEKFQLKISRIIKKNYNRGIIQWGKDLEDYLKEHIDYWENIKPNEKREYPRLYFHTHNVNFKTNYNLYRISLFNKKESGNIEKYTEEEIKGRHYKEENSEKLNVIEFSKEEEKTDVTFDPIKSVELNFKNWLRRSSPKLPKALIHEMVVALRKINSDLIKKNIIELPIHKINPPEKLHKIKEQYFLVEEFKELNERENHRYSAALNKFIYYRESHDDIMIYEDSKKEINEEAKAGNIKRFVNCRIGQNEFRKKLLVKWDKKCPITGIDEESILVSSHIVPWSEANEDEKLDPENGILLSPLFDSLFDKYLISFDDEGILIFSSKLSDQNMKRLNLTDKIKIPVSPGMIPYLKYHRKELKRLEKKDEN